MHHCQASFGAAVAGLGAVLAVLRLVPGTLIATGLADFGAKAADGNRMVAASGHRRRGKLADRRTVDVQRDALGHHLHVLLSQAGSSAVVACRRASVASFDTRGISFM